MAHLPKELCLLPSTSTQTPEHPEQALLINYSQPFPIKLQGRGLPQLGRECMDFSFIRGTTNPCGWGRGGPRLTGSRALWWALEQQSLEVHTLSGKAKQPAKGSKSLSVHERDRIKIKYLPGLTLGYRLSYQECHFLPALLPSPGYLHSSSSGCRRCRWHL